MTEHKLVGNHPEDLADGRVLGPGEVAELSKEDLKDPHNQRLIEEELLIPTEEAKTTSGRTSKQKEDE